MRKIGTLPIPNRAVNLGLIMAASGIRGLGQWLFVVILIRAFGPEGVGQYGFATALVVPVVALTTMQLPRVIATEKVGEQPLENYIGVQLIGLLINCMILIPLTFMVDGETIWPVVGLLVQTGAMAYVDIQHASILQQSRMRLYGVANLLTQLAAWSTPLIVLLLGGSMAASLGASGLALVASYLVLWTVLRSRNMPPLLPGFGAVKVIEMANLPLGLALFVDSLVTHSPRFLLENSHGVHQLGIFVSLLTFLSASTLFSESIGQAVTPWITRLVHRRERKQFEKFVRDVAWATLLLIVLVPLAAWFLGPPLASILLDDELGGYPFAIAGLALIAMLHLSNRMSMTSLNAAKALGPLFGVNIAALVVALVTGWLLIPDYGVNGAVATLAAANIVRSLIVHWMFSALGRVMDAPAIS